MRLPNLKKALGKPAKDERGQVFILVLVLMLISALIITPLTTYMYSGRVATTHNEVRMQELYAADAGAEDAIQKIRLKTVIAADDLPQVPGDNIRYNLSSTSGQLNGKTVNPVTITCLDNATYKVVSVALSAGGQGTAVTAIVSIANFFNNLLYNAITSPAHVEIGPGGVVNGTVQCPDIFNQGTINGTSNTTAPPWPPFVGMSGFYLEQVQSDADTVSYASSVTINLTGSDASPTEVPPLYVNGDLEFGGPGVGKLTGTVYVTGGVSFQNKDIKLILGDNTTDAAQTVYIVGDGYATNGAPWSFKTEPHKTSLKGPGAIISERGIDFQPDVSGSDFIFIMSTGGTVNFQPNGSFVGSVAGDVEVDLQPGNTVTWAEPPAYLNVPGNGDLEANVVQKIAAWTINIHMPVIVTGSLAPGQQGVAYSGELVAAGGTEPYTWALSSGTMPSGLTLSSAGFVTGTPTSLGSYSFTVTMNDSAGGSDQASISMTVYPALGSITSLPTPLPNGELGIAYPGATMGVSGGTTPYSWTWSGAVPPGLTLSASGLIGGTPTAVGTYSPTFVVTDANEISTSTSSKSITVTIAPLVITTTSLPDGKKNKPYGATGGTPSTPVFVEASGGTTPRFWSIPAGKPVWLSVNASTGQLTGTPPNTGGVTYGPFTVHVTDLVRSDDQTLTIHIP